MSWNKYILSKFGEKKEYSIVEEGNVVIVNSNSFKKNKLSLIFIFDNNNIKEIFANYSRSRIVLSFTDFMGENSFFSRIKDEKELSKVDKFLNIVIYEGWKEKLYMFKDGCYKIHLFFGEKREPLVYKLSFFDNFLFYCRMFVNYIFKELESTNLDTNTFVEEEFIIFPLEN